MRLHQVMSILINPNFIENSIENSTNNCPWDGSKRVFQHVALCPEAVSELIEQPPARDSHNLVVASPACIRQLFSFESQLEVHNIVVRASRTLRYTAVSKQCGSGWKATGEVLNVAVQVMQSTLQLALSALLLS